MILSFKQWLEDCGVVTRDYANSDDSDNGSTLSYLPSKLAAGKRKPKKGSKDFRNPIDPDKLFRNKMKK